MAKEYIERDYVIREACGELCGCEPNECGFDKPCAIVKRYKNWPAADVRENDELDELINEAVLTLNNIYIACRIKKDDYVRLLNDICAIRGAEMMNLAKTSQEPCNDFAKYDPAEFFNRKKPTNADRIRGMDDEELADVLDHIQGDAYLVGIGERKNSVYPGAEISWLDWLRQEVEP